MKELEDAAAIVKELRLAQGDGTDWTEDLFARAADVIESLSAPPTEDEREALARLIDPSVFTGPDWRDAHDERHRNEGFDRERATYEVADRIIASPVWRNRHREPITDEMVRAARYAYLRTPKDMGGAAAMRAALEAAESTRTGDV